MTLLPPIAADSDLPAFVTGNKIYLYLVLAGAAAVLLLALTKRGAEMFNVIGKAVDQWRLRRNRAAKADDAARAAKAAADLARRGADLADAHAQIANLSERVTALERYIDNMYDALSTHSAGDWAATAWMQQAVATGTVPPTPPPLPFPPLRPAQGRP